MGEGEALDFHYSDKLDLSNPCESNPGVYHYALDLTGEIIAYSGINTSYRWAICTNREPYITRFRDSNRNETLLRISNNVTAFACHDNPMSNENCTYQYAVNIPGADCYPSLFWDCAAGYKCVLRLTQINISRRPSLVGNCSSTYPWAVCCRSMYEENCTNNIDDDFDGFIDCADPECNDIATDPQECGASTHIGQSTNFLDYHCSDIDQDDNPVTPHCCPAGTYWDDRPWFFGGQRCADFHPCYPDLGCDYDPNNPVEIRQWAKDPQCVFPDDKVCCYTFRHGQYTYAYCPITVY